MEPSKDVGITEPSGMKPVSGPVVQIDEGRIHAHLSEVVRSTVEETLNALLDARPWATCREIPSSRNKAKSYRS